MTYWEPPIDPPDDPLETPCEKLVDYFASRDILHVTKWDVEDAMYRLSSMADIPRGIVRISDRELEELTDWINIDLADIFAEDAA